MGIEVAEKIDLKIIAEGKTSVYPITVYLHLSPEMQARVDAGQEKIKEQSEKFEETAAEAARLAQRVRHLAEDLEDTDELIRSADDESRTDLVKERKKLRKALRKSEDALEKHRKTHPISVYREQLLKMSREAAQEGFDINVKRDENREALERAMEKYGIRVETVMEEIRILIEAARKKKKRR